MKTKRMDCELKGDTDGGEVELYAAVFGNVDRDREVIEPGAFVNLEEFTRDGWLGTNHDFSKLPVASITSAAQDARGLKLTAQWHTTDEAQKCRTVVRERIERGKSVKCSIGFRVLESSDGQIDGQRVTYLKSIRLLEASIVNLPANPLAEVTAIKSERRSLTARGVIDELETAVKEGRTLSRQNLAKVRSWAERCRENAKLADEMDALANLCDPEAATGKALRERLRRRALQGRAAGRLD